MNNVLVITYWSYKDALIQSYSLPYIRMIRKQIGEESSVHLVTIEQPHFACTQVEKEEIKAALQKEGIEWHAYSYTPFGYKAMFRWVSTLFQLYHICKDNQIQNIHTFATPAGVIGYLLNRIVGKRLIIDSYEPHAESMVENGTWDDKSLAYRILFSFEKKMTQRAAVVIGTTQGMLEYAEKAYRTSPNRFYHKPACVDLELFQTKNLIREQIRKSLNLENNIVCVYAGKIGGIYLEQEIFDFIKQAVIKWGDRFRLLLLSNISKEDLHTLCEKSKVNKNIVIQQFVPYRNVPEYLSVADFALNPVKPVPSKQYCTSIKDGEYWAMGLPVVIPRNISDDAAIIEKEKIGYVLQSFTTQEYQKALEKIDEIRFQPNIVEKIRSVAKKYRDYSIAQQVYQEIYVNLYQS